MSEDTILEIIRRKDRELAKRQNDRNHNVLNEEMQVFLKKTFPQYTKDQRYELLEIAVC